MLNDSDLGELSPLLPNAALYGKKRWIRPHWVAIRYKTNKVDQLIEEE